MKLIAHANAETPVITPDGAQRRVLCYSDNLMLVQFSFAANAKSWEHSHPHEQIGYVVSGEIDFYMEGHAPVRLQAGGSYYVAGDVRHYIATYAETVLVDCFTPQRADFLA